MTWGCASDVSKYGSVREQLAAVVHDIKDSSECAWAALTRVSNGDSRSSVVTWADARGGGDSSGVQGQLADGVIQLASTLRAFAPVKSSGVVVTWGDGNSGGSSGSISDQP